MGIGTTAFVIWLIAGMLEVHRELAAAPMYSGPAAGLFVCQGGAILSRLSVVPSLARACGPGEPPAYGLRGGSRGAARSYPRIASSSAQRA